LSRHALKIGLFLQFGNSSYTLIFISSLPLRVGFSEILHSDSDRTPASLRCGGGGGGGVNATELINAADSHSVVATANCYLAQQQQLRQQLGKQQQQLWEEQLGGKQQQLWEEQLGEQPTPGTTFYPTAVQTMGRRRQKTQQPLSDSRSCHR
jgi:hypothetical protein